MRVPRGRVLQCFSLKTRLYARYLSSSSSLPPPPLRHYTEVLGVAHTDSFAKIKVAFRSLAKENHPDLNPNADERKMQELLQAYAEAKEEVR